MEIDAYAQRMDALRKEAEEQAIARYENNWDDVNKIRQGLRRVKEGLRNLIDLDEDEHRKASRLRREHMPDYETAAERVNGIADFQETWIIDQIAKLKSAVCRLTLDGQGVGTGFLVADGVILTNNHVIPDEVTANKLTAEFGYELDAERKLQSTCKVRCRPDLLFQTSTIREQPDIPWSGLDYTFVGIDSAPELAQTGDCRYHATALDGTAGKIVIGEPCIIIQHPAGEPKKVVFRNTALLKLTDRHLIYESDTLPGSSGSMIIGLGTGEIVGLHHSGVPERDEQGHILTKTGAIAGPGTPDGQIKWVGNEGIRISCILTAFEEAPLPEEMEPLRKRVLRRTRAIKQATAVPSSPPVSASPPPTKNESAHPVLHTPNPTLMAPKNEQPAAMHPVQKETAFSIIVRNTETDIKLVNASLSARYGHPIAIVLQMPLTARREQPELFYFSVAVSGNPYDEAAQLLRLPSILAAEPDLPMYLNSGDTQPAGSAAPFSAATESSVKDVLWEDIFAVWNENDYYDEQGKWKTGFLNRWRKEREYVDPEDLNKTRRWNQMMTRFNLVTPEDYKTLADAQITVAQLDTGYSSHSKIVDGFNIAHGYDAVGKDPWAKDELVEGYGKFPGHGTRTGSLLIGRLINNFSDESHEGNWGLLSEGKTKLIPFRIAETVILLNRQQELSAAIDRIIGSHGVQVLTMSMGTAPTITTARLAQRAYEAGIIWCCAAGNQVKFVVAPAVFPGTIAVAACNPAGEPWKGSSEGDAVDITAPGEDVYVPIWRKGADGKPEEDYAYGDGTSYATPHVAAAAALWLAKYKETVYAYPKPWMRVEAFRYCLKKTARKIGLPKGYGAGLLDVDRLLHHADGAPPTLEDFDDIKKRKEGLRNAYDGWNESAFFAAVQGWGELAKTYWRRIHRGIGRIFGAHESMMVEESATPVSSFALEQEAMLFGISGALESDVAATPEHSLYRMQQLTDLILTSAQNPTSDDQF